MKWFQTPLWNQRHQYVYQAPENFWETPDGFNFSLRRIRLIKEITSWTINDGNNNSVNNHSAHICNFFYKRQPNNKMQYQFIYLFYREGLLKMRIKRSSKWCPCLPVIVFGSACVFNSCHSRTHKPAHPHTQTHPPTQSIHTKSRAKQIRHLAFIRHASKEWKKENKKKAKNHNNPRVYLGWNNDSLAKFTSCLCMWTISSQPTPSFTVYVLTQSSN